MSPRRSSRTPKPSLKNLEQSLRMNGEVIQPQTNGTRQRKMGLKKSKASSSKVNTDKKKDCDILDIISNSHSTETFLKKDDRPFAEITDQGVDESDEDCVSVNSSIVSGPSMHFQASPKESRTPQNLCSACHNLYLKAKRMKAPMKDKLLDNNPKSLTCDHWVLFKSRRPKRLLNSRGDLLTYITMVKRRLNQKSQSKHMEQSVREREQSSCSKPHVFLQRNLRRCVRVPAKKVMKKNRKKRKTEEPQGSRVTKKQRLHSRKQDVLVHTVQPSMSGHLPLEESCDEKVDTVDFFPGSVSPEITIRAPAGSSKANKKSKFGMLLAQLRGNSSMVVRETR